MKLPWKRKERTGSGVDEDDVEAVIFRNLWKHHRLLPPRSKYRSYWDAVRVLRFVRPRCPQRLLDRPPRPSQHR